MSDDACQSIANELGDVDQIAQPDLRTLVDAQASIIEFIASKAPLEDTLLAIAGELEDAWTEADVGFLMTDAGTDQNVTSVLDLPAAVSNALQDVAPATLVETMNADDLFAPFMLRATEDCPKWAPLTQGLSGCNAGAAWFLLVTAPDDETPCWMIVVVAAASPLSLGEQALLRRFAHLAHLAIDQHRAELQLQRLIADERRRLAGVIHDDPIQALTAVGLRIQRLARHVDGDVADQVAELHAAVGTAIERMRRLLIDLHPPTLDDEGLVSAIDVYLGEVLEPLGLTCSLVETVHEEPAPGTASLAYRLVSEALWNVAKHAEAKRVNVAVVMDGGAVEILITDDGIGFDTAKARRRKAGHMGISACRELANRASGTWSVDSGPTGTTVRIWLPGPAPLEASSS